MSKRKKGKEDSAIFRDRVNAKYGIRELAPGALNQLESFWSKHQPWLEEHGYRLRPRFRPDWKPSWKEGTWPLDAYEDAQRNKWGNLLDATRISDNSLVMLKKALTPERSQEEEIGLYFSRPELRKDSSNHCVPFIDVLPCPNRDDGIIIVMPLLRAFDDPPFERFSEAITFFSQIFQGLDFMHRHNVAHRDCADLNILYDPRPMFPNMFHPVNTTRSLDFKAKVKHLSRAAHLPTYFLIDFGLSRRYDNRDHPIQEGIIQGIDKTAPEHQDESATTCDPFPTDVYYIGNLVRTDFIQKYHGFQFMEPLIHDMVQTDPAKRPTMDVVLARYTNVANGLTSMKLNWPLIRRKDWAPVKIYKTLRYFGLELFVSEPTQAMPLAQSRQLVKSTPNTSDAVAF